uniref:Thioredoxin-like fold domain-containing protein n=1 Tax=Leersia perrieri TaxID=77586 RepID=A0A0D9XG72_9ORYZ
MARAPAVRRLMRRAMVLCAVAATFSYYLLVLHAQASVPSPRYDGFAYGDAATAAWKDTVLVEAFLDPLCPDSRDAWAPLRLAVDRYAPRVSLIGKFYNAATSSLSSTVISGEISKMAAQVVGSSVSEFQSGFSDIRTDLAARVSFRYGCTRGVAGAPFFFVNGFLQPGGGSPIDYSTWISVLDPIVGQHGDRLEMFTSM